MNLFEPKGFFFYYYFFYLFIYLFIYFFIYFFFFLYLKASSGVKKHILFGEMVKEAGDHKMP